MARPPADTGTLLGIPVHAVPGVPPCIVWFDQLGMLRVRLLTTDREFVRIGNAWKEWPKDGPPDQVPR